MASTSVTCKELVANRQAISIDMRSAEPTPTANACYGLLDTATFFGLLRLRDAITTVGTMCSCITLSLS